MSLLGEYFSFFLLLFFFYFPPRLDDALLQISCTNQSTNNTNPSSSLSHISPFLLLESDRDNHRVIQENLHANIVISWLHRLSSPREVMFLTPSNSNLPCQTPVSRLFPWLFRYHCRLQSIEWVSVDVSPGKWGWSVEKSKKWLGCRGSKVGAAGMFFVHRDCLIRGSFLSLLDEPWWVACRALHEACIDSRGNTCATK